MIRTRGTSFLPSAIEAQHIAMIPSRANANAAGLPAFRYIRRIDPQARKLSQFPFSLMHRLQGANLKGHSLLRTPKNKEQIGEDRPGITAVAIFILESVTYLYLGQRSCRLVSPLSRVLRRGSSTLPDCRYLKTGGPAEQSRHWFEPSPIIGGERRLAAGDREERCSSSLINFWKDVSFQSERTIPTNEP